MRRLPYLLSLIILLSPEVRAQWAPNGVRVSVTSPYTTTSLADGGWLLIGPFPRSGPLSASELNRCGYISQAGAPSELCDATCPDVTGGVTYRTIPDGAGGAITTWFAEASSRPFVQKVDSGGRPQWGVNGLELSTASMPGWRLGDFAPHAAPDGQGGVIVAWVSGPIAGEWAERAQLLAPGGQRQWAGDGLLVTNGPSAGTVALVPDGLGGAVLLWLDNSSPSGSLRAQRFDAQGNLHWGADGVLLCGALDCGNAVGSIVTVLPDFAGGALIVGKAGGLFLQHISGSGQILYSGFGAPVCTEASLPQQSFSTVDGDGGAIIAWRDDRPDAPGIYAQHMTSTGARLWGDCGIRLWSGAGAGLWNLVDDGAGGWLVAWSSGDVYAQRITAGGALAWPMPGARIDHSNFPPNDDISFPRIHYGLSAVVPYATGVLLLFGTVACDSGCNAIGTTAAAFDLSGVRLPDQCPAVTSVDDVPNDQGSQLTVAWTQSPLEADALSPVTAYEIQTESSGWQVVATQPANGAPSYARTVPTSAVLTAGQPAPQQAFRVVGVTTSALRYKSATRSGYSVDNVAPTVALAPAFENPGLLILGAQLGNVANDFAQLCWFRGNCLDPPTDVPAQCGTDLFLVDNSGVNFCYRAQATDIHGNVGPMSAAVGRANPTEVDGVAHPTGTWVHLEGQNPAVAGAQIEFGLAAPGSARLSVVDVRGRVVRAFTYDGLPAGIRSVRWDGRDRDGVPVAAGVYVAKLEAAGVTRTARLVLVR